MQWTEITIEAPERLTDAISNFLIEQGASGVWEQGGFPCLVRGYYPSGESAVARDRLDAYLDSLYELYPRSPRAFVTARVVADEDWANRWKEYFHPHPVGKSFYLVPTWRSGEPVPADREPLFVDPGMAFGTGWHESTRLCIELLEDWAECLSGDVLDAGTGSGILSVVACKLGARSVLGVDTDSVAIEVAGENAVLNGCADRARFVHAAVEDVTGTYDFVVANILLEVHTRCVRRYRELLAPSAPIVLSGLLRTQAEEIETLLSGAGLRVEDRRESGEWFACLARA